VTGEQDARRQEPIVRAIVECELHERIFQGTWQVIPAFTGEDDDTARSMTGVPGLSARGASMADIHIVRDYPYPPAKVWRAVTDPELIPLWTATGQGARPVGFAPVAGTRFQFVAKPVPGWRGIVDCEVLEVREPSLLRFSWVGEEGGKPTYVTYQIEPHDGGTRFTYAHTGFTGLGGFFMAKLLGSVRKKMLTVGLPAVLDDLDDTGAAGRPGPVVRGARGPVGG
jgi:uncharacterized protein YndB with AHSA1/START domain